MNIVKVLSTSIVPVTMAVGLTVAGTFTSAWGADASAIQAAPIAAVPAKEQAQVPLIDDRLLAIGLGVLGGVVVYTTFASNWGVGATRIARGGIPSAAAMRWGAGWGGRWIFATASGVIGALVGDWIHRSNEVTTVTH